MMDFLLNMMNGFIYNDKERTLWLMLIMERR